MDEQEKEPIKSVPIKATAEHKEQLGKKLKRIFLSEDVDHLGEYIFWDVLVPSVQNLFSDMLHTVADVSFSGGRGRRSIASRDSLQRTAALYIRSSANGGSIYNRQSIQTVQTIRSIDDFMAFIYDVKDDALYVLNAMEQEISDYGVCTVQNVYGYLKSRGIVVEKEPGNYYTNNDWGWTDIKNTKIIRVKNGWMLDLPKPKQIDKN